MKRSFRRIQSLMVEKGIDKKTLAQIVGVVPSAVTRWANGGEIRIKYIQKMASYFGVTVNWLLCRDDGDNEVIMAREFLDNMPREKMAKNLGISESEVFDMELGKREITPMMRSKINNLLAAPENEGKTWYRPTPKGDAAKAKPAPVKEQGICSECAKKDAEIKRLQTAIDSLTEALLNFSRRSGENETKGKGKKS